MVDKKDEYKQPSPEQIWTPGELNHVKEYDLGDGIRGILVETPMFVGVFQYFGGRLDLDRIHSAGDFAKLPGWPRMKRFLNDARREYETNSYAEILRRETIAFPERWKALAPSEQGRVKRAVAKLDVLS